MVFDALHSRLALVLRYGHGDVPWMTACTLLLGVVCARRSIPNDDMHVLTWSERHDAGIYHHVRARRLSVRDNYLQFFDFAAAVQAVVSLAWRPFFLCRSWA